MTRAAVRYLVFDCESVADPLLVAKLRYPNEAIEPAAAVRKWRDELMERYNNDFIPYTYQVPASVVVAKVDETYRLIDLVALDEPAFRSNVITENFWRGWEAYKRPTLVSFNGRTFDLPLLELAAFRFGISLPGWFQNEVKQYEQPRNRYNHDAHLDLHDILTNYGATRFQGGLNLAANLLGKPGKIDVEGNMVQDLYEAGGLAEINDYCRCDVLDTYFVFLRVSVLCGHMTLDQEQQIVHETKDWLESRKSEIPIFGHYLRHWGDWKNPWKSEVSKQLAGAGTSNP